MKLLYYVKLFSCALFSCALLSRTHATPTHMWLALGPLVTCVAAFHEAEALFHFMKMRTDRQVSPAGSRPARLQFKVTGPADTAAWIVEIEQPGKQAAMSICGQGGCIDPGDVEITLSAHTLQAILQRRLCAGSCLKLMCPEHTHWINADSAMLHSRAFRLFSTCHCYPSKAVPRRRGCLDLTITVCKMVVRSMENARS